MKVHLSPTEDRGMSRILAALQRHAPRHIEFTSAQDADLIVFPVNGRLGGLKRAIQAYNKPYAIVQVAQRSTMNPDPADWLSVWQGALLVWSYYDLKGDFNFYRAPLGVDPTFAFTDQPKKYIVCAIGDYLTEGVRECILGAKDRPVAHIGKNKGKSNEVAFQDITDTELSTIYSQSEYVSGLRRIEGFEMPCAEGLVCGARPIMYDQPHYRDWYGNLAEYIPEQSRPEVLASLERLFAQPIRSVTPAEREEAKRRFNWDIIIKGFWKQLI